MTLRQAASGMRVFVDSTAYFALAAEKDANHGAALAILRRLERERFLTVTTRYILAETHALIVNRLRRSELALKVITEIEQSANTRVEPITEVDEAAARRLSLIHISEPTRPY